MIVETDRLIIRDVALPDGEAFIHMASDGSLNDVNGIILYKSKYGATKKYAGWLSE